jgi:integrase
LRLKVSDVLDEKGKIKDRISLREKKTGKFKDFPICETVRKALQEYLQDSQLGHGDYLFPSRKGRGPITRIQAYRVINDACRLAGVNEPVGTHTMRKTFGYHAYKRGLDLAIIQKMLNHSSPSTTLAYIGITQEDQDNVYMSLNL